MIALDTRAPVTPPISAAEASNPSKPFLVKLHAPWCHLCLITTSVWSQIEREYSGRVNFLVLDFTDDETTGASKAAAERVGLGRIFEESGSTGVVLIVDGRTKEVAASIAAAGISPHIVPPLTVRSIAPAADDREDATASLR